MSDRSNIAISGSKINFGIANSFGTRNSIRKDTLNCHNGIVLSDGSSISIAGSGVNFGIGNAIY